MMNFISVSRYIFTFSVQANRILFFKTKKYKQYQQSPSVALLTSNVVAVCMRYKFVDDPFIHYIYYLRNLINSNVFVDKTIIEYTRSACLTRLSIFMLPIAHGLY